VSARTAIRILLAFTACGWAFVAGMYLVNPLKIVSYDPLLRVCGFKPFRMPSTSMEPTIHRNDVFIAYAWPYWHEDPRPGDIVVFRYPSDPAVFFAKRIIAAGGSTVEIVEGVTIVDGQPIREPYVDSSNRQTPASLRMQPVEVSANSYFVMGDNRDNSDDSRSWGFVPRSGILGKVQ
jgi:signal peptidase I